MIRFRSAQVAEAAAELGLTEEALTNCIRHPDLNVCKERLESLKVQLKKAYRESALRLHPDRTGNDETKTDLFKRVTRLWEELQRLEVGPRPRPQPVRYGPVVTVVVTGSGGYTSTSSSTSTNTCWGGWKAWGPTTG